MLLFRNLPIDIAKGIAIILVVEGHVVEHSMAPWHLDFFQNPLFKIIYTFHMPLFVFISGYLMAYSLNRMSVVDVLRARCKSLLIPFITTSLLGALLVMMINVREGYIDKLLLHPQVWFLFTLFVVSFLLLCSVQLEKFLGIFGFLCIYLLLMIVPYHEYGDLYYIQWFYLFYLGGYFYNRCGIQMPKASIKTGMALMALVLFIWLSIYWGRNDYIYVNEMNFLPNHLLGEGGRLIYRYIMGFLGIGIAFYLADLISRVKGISVLATIGTYSLDIYIIQMLLLEGIYPMWVHKMGIHLDFHSAWILYGATPIITMFFIGLCIVISKYGIRKNNLLNRLFLGGRA